jgi:hypothetical protein
LFPRVSIILAVRETYIPGVSICGCFKKPAFCAQDILFLWIIIGVYLIQVVLLLDQDKVGFVWHHDFAAKKAKFESA